MVRDRVHRLFLDAVADAPAGSTIVLDEPAGEVRALHDAE